MKDKDFEKLKCLLKYSDKYEISIHFRPQYVSVFISKDDVELSDYGGDFTFAIDKSIKYLDRINKKIKWFQ